MVTWFWRINYYLQDRRAARRYAKTIARKPTSEEIKRILDIASKLPAREAKILGEQQ